MLPAAAERIETAFAREEPLGGRPRFVAGSAVTFAVGAAAYPGIVLAIAVLVTIRVFSGPAPAPRCCCLIGAGAVGAAVLLFPFVPTLFADGGRALSSLVGTIEPVRLARLALGPGPGTWPVAAFLPIGAVLGLGLVRGELRGPAARAAVAAGAGLILSWLAAANYLPPGLANPPAYAALAAVSMASLIGFGLTSFTGSLRSESFGLRQVSGGVLTLVLGAGLLLQSMAAMVGTWGVGPPEERIPAAWAVVSGAARGSFRVLWLTGDRGDGLPPPAGDPQRRLEEGDATIRYALTDREGATVLDIGRPFAGPGPENLERALGEIFGGTTRHGGALLSPFGIRFLVAERGVLPPAAEEALDAQLDVDLLPATGFTIYRNATAIPPEAVLATEAEDREIMAAGDPSTIAMWRAVPAEPLEQVSGGWDGPGVEGTVFLSSEYDAQWALEGTSGQPGGCLRLGDSVRGDRGAGPSPTRGSAARSDPGRAPRGALARCALGHEEAGGSMSAAREPRARGQMVFALGTVVVIVAALVLLDRTGTRTPARLAAADAPSGAWLCPHGGSGMSVALYLANPGPATVTARVTRLGPKQAGPPERFDVAAGTTLRIEDVPPDREAATYVEYFGGWIGAGWVSSTDEGVAAEPCAPDAARRWFLADGTTLLDEEAFVIVANPFAAAAVMDVVLYTADASADPGLGVDRPRGAASPEHLAASQLASQRRDGGRRRARGIGGPCRRRIAGCRAMEPRSGARSAGPSPRRARRSH